MAGYKKKDAVDLAWLDNRDQVKLDIRKLTRRLEDEVLASLSAEFTAGIARGELIEIRPGEEEIARLLSKQAERLVLTVSAGGEDA